MTDTSTQPSVAEMIDHLWNKNKRRVSDYICGNFRSAGQVACGSSSLIPKDDMEQCVHQLVTEAATLPDEDLHEVVRLMNEMRQQEGEARATRGSDASGRMESPGSQTTPEDEGFIRLVAPTGVEPVLPA